MTAEAVAAHLARLAAAGQTATYGAMARDLGLRMAALTAALEATMAEDAAAGHPFRAALACGRLSGGQPARGFFDAAAALGRAMTPETVEADRAALFAAAAAR